MAEIKLYDYWDEWGWMYYGIGMGDLSASVIVPLIEAAKDEDLTVRINSGGGSVFDGWAIYNALLNHPKKVTVQIDGIAASIASIIAMAGKEVVAMKGSMLMVHKPSTAVWMYSSMDADMLRKEAEVLDKIQAVLNSIYAVKTGLDSATIDGLINEETWLTPNEALDLHFIDSIKDGANVGIIQNAFNHIFNSAPARVKAYANQHIPVIKINDQMKKETKEALKQNKGLLSGLKNAFKEFFNKIEDIQNAESTTKDGTTFYYEGELAEGTEVFSDADMTTALADGDYELEDGRTMTVAEGSVSSIAESGNEEENNEGDDKTDSEEITELKNRIAELEAANEELQAENQEVTTALNESNKVLNTLKAKKSNYVPKDRKQDFNKSGQTPPKEENKKFKLPSKEK